MTENPTGGVQRRTIVSGAAWTIPVVAVAVATPAAAASLQPTLEFINGPYTVDACGTLGAIVLEATTNGSTAVTDGTLITVTLPAGLTWADGSTAPRALPTSGGQLTLTGLKATGASGPVLISATGNGLSTTETVSIRPSGTAYTAIANLGPTALSNVPSDATAVGGGYFLSTDGTLYFNNTPLQTGVTTATGTAYGSTQQRVYYQDATGDQWVITYSNGSAGAPSNLSDSWPLLPADAVPINAAFSLTPTGDLWYYGYKIATGVTQPVGYYGINGEQVDYFVGGTAYTAIANLGPTALSNVPSDATAVGGGYFLSTDGTLYFNNTPLQTGVTTATGTAYGSTQQRVYYQDATGDQWVITYSNGAPNSPTRLNDSWPLLPADAVPINAAFSLTPTGDLWYYGYKIATGVTQAVGYYGINGEQVDYVVGTVC